MQYITEEHPLHCVLYISSALEYEVAERKSRKDSCLQRVYGRVRNYNCGKVWQIGISEATVHRLKREHPMGLVIKTSSQATIINYFYNSLE